MKLYCSYPEIQNKLLPGDVIAFTGHNQFCNLIKSVLNFPISHVGVISRIVKSDKDYETVPYIYESGLIHGFDGVSENLFDLRILEYTGEIFVLRLNKIARKRLNYDKLLNWLLS